MKVLTKYWESVSDFQRHVERTYTSNYVKNVNLVDLTARLKDFHDPKDPPLLVSVEKDSKTIATLLRTNKNRGIILSEFSEDSTPNILQILKTEKPESLIGQKKSISQIKSKLENIRHGFETNFYILKKLIKPNDSIGELKIVSGEQCDIVYRYMLDFYAEAMPNENPVEKEFIENGIKLKKYYFFESDNKIVTYIGWNGSLTHPKIAPVFTPEKFRKKGFGKKGTYLLCKEIQKHTNKPISLFADTTNKASNKVYTSIGFEHIENYTTCYF